MSREFERVAANMLRNNSVGSPQIRGRGAFRVGAPARKGMGPNTDEVIYDDEEYYSGGDTYFGIGAVVIPAGASRQAIKRNPIRPFKPLEFRCKSSVQDLIINQIKIRGTEYFANEDEDGMPIETFSEVSEMAGLEWETIQTDTGVTILVSNPTDEDLVFSGGWQGVQLRS